MRDARALPSARTAQIESDHTNAKHGQLHHTTTQHDNADTAQLIAPTETHNTVIPSHISARTYNCTLELAWTPSHADVQDPHGLRA